MKLISCTDFVLEQAKLKKDTYELSHLLIDYANFLKEYLTLGMFVPAKLVNGEWIVLEEPKIRCSDYGNISTDEYIHILEEYQEAKDRVLFEGWKVSEKRKSHVLITDKLNTLSFIHDGAVIRKVSPDKDSYVNVKCLEEFFNNLLYSKNDDLYVKKELLLTESAKKQILGS